MIQLVIVSTDDIYEVDGAKCRRWSGRTAAGAPCDVFVRLIRVATEHIEEFEATNTFPISIPTTEAEKVPVVLVQPETLGDPPHYGPPVLPV